MPVQEPLPAVTLVKNNVLRYNSLYSICCISIYIYITLLEKKNKAIQPDKLKSILRFYCIRKDNDGHRITSKSRYSKIYNCQ
jgi:hypothetical protein